MYVRGEHEEKKVALKKEIIQRMSVSVKNDVIMNEAIITKLIVSKAIAYKQPSNVT